MFGAMRRPETPAEAIASRRNASYGLTIVIDIQYHQALMTLLRKTRDSIISIINPNKSSTPARSPLYIKQTFFHASILGTNPLWEKQLFIDLCTHENGCINREAMDKMCNTLHAHLIDQNPYLESLQFELNETDGSILARFSYQAQTCHPDTTPLRNLKNQLDPENKFSTWGAKNPSPDTTVAVVLCVVNINDLTQDQLNTIKTTLSTSSQQLNAIGQIEVNQFQLINSYDKRTLSLKHISLYAIISENQINKIR